jgi:hypothetical protein
MYVFEKAPHRVGGRESTAGTGADMVSFFRSRKPTAKRADSRLIPAKHVVSTMHGTRTVLLDSRSGHYYGLDEVGTRIWGLAQAGFPAATITEKLASEYDAPPERLAHDVDAFLLELKNSRLLEEQ